MGVQWNRYMNNVKIMADNLWPLEIAGLTTTQEYIFQVVVTCMVDINVQDRVARFLQQPITGIWYCFEKLVDRGPYFSGAIIREKPGHPGDCAAHLEVQCLQVRLASEAEKRRGGGKVVWRGD